MEPTKPGSSAPSNGLSQIDCPQCGAAISLTQALTQEIEEKYKTKFSQRFEQEREKLRAQREAMVKEMEAKLAHNKAAVEKRLREEIAGATKVELEDLKQQLQEKNRRLDDAVKNELDLRKRARELEEKEKALEIELQRKLDAEKARLAEEISKRVGDDFRLKAAEKDKQLEDMRKQIEELKRKAEQSSQQMQGEVLELEIECLLRAQFPGDAIEPVAKGVRGADVLQRVMTSNGVEAGSIVWEMKRTKSWSDGWVPKLKEDQRAVTAEFAVIVSQVLPKDVKGIAQIDGVWVTDISCVAGLALALRHHVMQLHLTRNATAHKGEKMEFLYAYLTGTQFRQRIEAIVEAFRTMQEDLEREKRAFQKMWAAREQQLTRVLTNTAGMYGDVQGIVGATLPTLPALELDGGLDDTAEAKPVLSPGAPTH